MEQVERLQYYPERYGQLFEDVFAYYAATGEYSFEREYQKSERCRVWFDVSNDGLIIGLDHITYDGDWNPSYTPLYQIEESGEEPVYTMHQLARDQVPYQAFTEPELVLRSVLHNAQDWVRYQQRMG